jgi:hypothetical protein
VTAAEPMTASFPSAHIASRGGSEGSTTRDHRSQRTPCLANAAERNVYRALTEQLQSNNLVIPGQRVTDHLKDHEVDSSSQSRAPALSVSRLSAATPGTTVRGGGSGDAATTRASAALCAPRRTARGRALESAGEGLASEETGGPVWAP